MLKLIVRWYGCDSDLLPIIIANEGDLVKGVLKYFFVVFDNIKWLKYIIK